MRYHIVITLILISIGISSCVTKRVPEGEVLLDKMSGSQILVVDDNVNLDSLDYLFKKDKYPGNLPIKPFSNKNLTRQGGKKAESRSAGQDVYRYDLEDIFKQKPNRTIFGFVKFHLWLYTRINQIKLEKKAKKKYDRIIKKNIKRRSKDVQRNMKRLLKGKLPKKLRPLKTYKPTWRERVVNGIGEAPVFVDTLKIRKSANQVQTYLFKKGYFNAEVTDTIIEHKKRPKATVYYIIKKGQPYRINTIKRNIENKDIAFFVDQTIKKEQFIKVNQIFDVDKLQRERKKIETRLLNEGYYAFSKDYIYYEIDSVLHKTYLVKTNPNYQGPDSISLGGTNNKSLLENIDLSAYRKDSTKLTHLLDINMGVTPVERQIGKDSLVREPHKTFHIKDVTIYSNYDINLGNNLENYDTMSYKVSGGQFMKIAYLNKLKVRASVLTDRVFILPGSLYRAKDVEATYKQLADLGVYRLVSIKFQKDLESAEPSLHCIITLTQSKRQAFSAETDGTNRGGNLGISGSVSYNHRNLFRGAENLGISMSGGLEVQQLFTNQDSTVGGSLNPIFNTIEFGPSISLDVPKAIFIDKWFKDWDHSSTRVEGGLNYQQRPDFTRNIQEGRLRWDFARKSNQFNFGYNLSSLKIIDQSQEFQDRLIELNDPILTNSFIDHIISSLSVGYTYNDQSPTRLKNVGYYSTTVELAGFFLRKFAGPLNLDYNPVNDSYSIFGIRFAEYVRTTQDFRFYQRFNSSSEMAYRVAGGIGIPFENIKDALPFERSFFAGGANSIRGWRARLLGPGAHLDTTFADRFDKIGDIYLEANMEYRFDLVDFIGGALFLDAGNIWLLNPSIARPTGQFSKSFYKEIAFAGGIGFRFDLDFFIVRLDVATRIKDPALPEGERWFFQEKTSHNKLRDDLGFDPYKPGLNFNFGIGYPF